MNTSGERDRSREESGSEEDPLTKTSPPGDLLTQLSISSKMSSFFSLVIFKVTKVTKVSPKHLLQVTLVNTTIKV